MSKIILPPNFSAKEIVCRCPNKCYYKDLDNLPYQVGVQGKSFNPTVWLKKVLEYLRELRWAYEGPIALSSVLRCTNHPAEVNKPHGPGAHTIGAAVDIKQKRNDDSLRGITIEMAGDHNRKGLGMALSFTHIDFKHPHNAFDKKRIWTYSNK